MDMCKYMSQEMMSFDVNFNMAAIETRIAGNTHTTCQD